MGGEAGSYDFAAVAGEAQVWSDRSTDAVTFANLGQGAVVGLDGDGNAALGAVAFNMESATDDVSIAIANGVGRTGAPPAVAGAGAATKATISSTGAANVVGTVDLASQTLASITISAATDLEGDFLSQATDQVGADGVVTISGGAETVEFTAALDNTIRTVDASGLTAGGLKASLGTGTESVTGGAGADTITLNIGIRTAALGAGDDTVTTAAVAVSTVGAVDGGAGTDRLIIAAATHVDTAVERAVYTGFEILRAPAATIDMDGFDGMTAVEAGDNDTTFVGLDATQAGAVTVIGTADTLDLRLGSATGTSDVATIVLGDEKIDSDISASLIVNGFETVNIISAGKKTGTDVLVRKIVSDTANAVNLSGSVDGPDDAAAEFLRLMDTGALARAVMIDASGVTGGHLVLGEASGVLVKGSSVVATGLNDVITSAAIVGGTGDFVTYDLGAGDDIFRSTAAILNNDSASNGSIKVEGGAGTDTLHLTATGELVDASFQFVTGFEKIMNSGLNQAVSIRTGGFFTANFAGGVEFVTNSGTANTSIDAYTFTAAVKATTTSSNGVTTIRTGYGDDTVAPTHAGAGAVTVETSLGADTIDVAGVTTSGAVTISAGAGDDIVKGVSVAATITGGAGADAITIGAGAQTIVIGNGDSGLTAATADRVAGFASGVDKLKTGVAGDAMANTGNYVEAAAAAAGFDAALTAANAALLALAGTSAATELYAFQFDATDGYLFNDTDGDGDADQVIVLLGIDNAGIAHTDVIL